MHTDQSCLFIDTRLSQNYEWELNNLLISLFIKNSQSVCSLNPTPKTIIHIHYIFIEKLINTVLLVTPETKFQIKPHDHA